MTPVEFEIAFAALPREERDVLLDRLREVHKREPREHPYLTPEQIALVNRRAEEVERGDGRTVSAEEGVAGLSEAIRRVGAGEDPDAVLAELRARRDAGWRREQELADAA